MYVGTHFSPYLPYVNYSALCSLGLKKSVLQMIGRHDVYADLQFL